MKFGAFNYMFTSRSETGELKRELFVLLIHYIFMGF